MSTPLGAQNLPSGNESGVFNTPIDPVGLFRSDAIGGTIRPLARLPVFR